MFSCLFDMRVLLVVCECFITFDIRQSDAYVRSIQLISFTKWKIYNIYKTNTFTAPVSPFQRQVLYYAFISNAVLVLARGDHLAFRRICVPFFLGIIPTIENSWLRLEDVQWETQLNAFNQDQKRGEIVNRNPTNQEKRLGWGCGSLIKVSYTKSKQRNKVNYTVNV